MLQGRARTGNDFKIFQYRIAIEYIGDERFNMENSKVGALIKIAMNFIRTCLCVHFEQSNVH